MRQHPRQSLRGRCRTELPPPSSRRPLCKFAERFLVRQSANPRASLIMTGVQSVYRVSLDPTETGSHAQIVVTNSSPAPQRTAKPGMEVASLTDVGRQRSNNEDSFL